MNTDNDRNEALSPELDALDAQLARLGAAERAAAPASLEGRIGMATAGVFAPKAGARAANEPKGVLGRLSVRRLDWPMRVAAVIAVMIGGWAVFHGVQGPGPKAGASFDAEKIASILASWEKSGASEQIQKLLIDANSLETLIGSDDVGLGDPSDQESL